MGRLLAGLCGLVLVGLLAACGGGDGSSAIDARRSDARQQPDAVVPDAIYGCVERTPGNSVTLPTNIIIVLGDGMGLNHLEAGRITKGSALTIDSLGSPVLLVTDGLEWDLNGEVVDSAAAATAIATGVRVRNERVSYEDGANLKKNLGDWAAEQGKAVGLITTSATFDASPAAFAAHNSDRDNQSAIATELVSATKPEVMLGGGDNVYENNTGALLSLAASEGYHVVRDATELAAWDPDSNPTLLGVFSSSVAAPNPFQVLFEFFMTPVARRDSSSTDPLLSAMVGRGLEALEKDSDGFFLLVENELIDSLSHVAVVDNDSSKAGIGPEVVALDDTVALIINWVEANSSWDETLLLVGADHETGDYTFTGNDLDTGTFPAAPDHTRAKAPWFIKGPGSASASSLCGLPDLFYLVTGAL